MPGGESWQGYPFAVTYAALLAIVLARGQATYWVARGIAGGAVSVTRGAAPGRRARLRARLTGPSLARGRDALDRFGLVVVPAAHLTVGLQTVVLAAAGFTRVPWVRFACAQLLGGLAWAAIYTTVGFAVSGAVIARALGSPWGLAALGAVVLALAAVLARGRAGAARRADPGGLGTG